MIVTPFDRYVRESFQSMVQGATFRLRWSKQAQTTAIDLEGLAQDHLVRCP
jgi:hypothetical protein